MNNLTKNEDINEQIDPRELFSLLWLNKNFIIIFSLFVSLLAVLYSLSLPNIYTAKTLIVPSQSSAAPNYGAQYGGLSSMAGITGPISGNNEKLDIALNLIKSKKLLDRLKQYESFLPNLLAANSWNMKKNTIVYDEKLYNSKDKVWIRNVSPPFKQIPSSQEALGKFLKLVSISQNTKDQLITLNVSHVSPVVAQQWSIWILNEINDVVADMDITNSKASIEYLNEKISTTPYSELKVMFYQLIQEATQSMMLAEVYPEYVLKTIDPPVIPELKSQPKRSLISILGFLIGGILSILIVIVRKYILNLDNELDVFKILRGLRS